MQVVRDVAHDAAGPVEDAVTEAFFCIHANGSYLMFLSYYIYVAGCVEATGVLLPLLEEDAPISESISNFSNANNSKRKCVHCKSFQTGSSHE